MKKLLLTLLIITVIISFSSCSERINSFSLDPAVFEAVDFTAKAKDYEYKGTLSCSENIAEIVLSEPSELKEMKFIIDENGIKCCENDVVMQYKESDFSDNFLFNELYKLIVSALGAEEFESKNGTYIYSFGGDSISFDSDGLPVSAHVDKYTLELSV